MREGMAKIEKGEQGGCWERVKIRWRKKGRGRHYGRGQEPKKCLLKKRHERIKL